MRRVSRPLVVSLTGVLLILIANPVGDLHMRMAPCGDTGSCASVFPGLLVLGGLLLIIAGLAAWAYKVRATRRRPSA